MSTYKPLATVVTAAAINRYNGNKLTQSIGTTAWNLVLMNGLATGKSMHVSGSVVVSAPVILKSGTVLGWYGTTAGSIGNADIQTFTDKTGKYGVTVNTGSALTLKFYAHG